MNADMESGRGFKARHLLVAALVGLGVGALLFDGYQPKPERREPVTVHQPQSSPDEPQPVAIIESQVIRKDAVALRAPGSHRVAVFNAGRAVLRMLPGVTGDDLHLDVPSEIGVGDAGFVKISWSPIDAPSGKPWCRSAEVYTNDPKNKTIRLAVVEDRNDATPESERPDVVCHSVWHLLSQPTNLHGQHERQLPH